MIVEILVTAGACALSALLGYRFGHDRSSAYMHNTLAAGRSEAWRNGYQAGLGIGRGIKVPLTSRFRNSMPPTRHD